MSKGEKLDSWKEISTYLNRSLRTVQRWHRDRNLPVHKDAGGGVYAYIREIDQWQGGIERETDGLRGRQFGPRMLFLLFTVLLALGLLATKYLVTESGEKPGTYSVRIEDHRVKVIDSKGEISGSHDFKPYFVQEAQILPTFNLFYPHTTKPAHILVLLNHPHNKSFSPDISITSVELDDCLAALDLRGNLIWRQSLIGLTELDTFGFARISCGKFPASVSLLQRALKRHLNIR